MHSGKREAQGNKQHLSTQKESSRAHVSRNQLLETGGSSRVRSVQRWMVAAEAILTSVRQAQLNLEKKNPKWGSNSISTLYFYFIEPGAQWEFQKRRVAADTDTVLSLSCSRKNGSTYSDLSQLPLLKSPEIRPPWRASVPHSAFRNRHAKFRLLLQKSIHRAAWDPFWSDRS